MNDSPESTVRELARAKRELEQARKRLADSVLAQATLEGTIVQALDDLPAMVRNYFQSAVALGMQRAKEVTSAKR